MLRYDTGDIATLIVNNNQKKIISIDGRSEDYITLPNGIKLGRLDHIFKEVSNIIESQIYQKNDFSILIRIVKANNYSEQNEKKLIKEIKKRIGDTTEFKIQYLDKIDRKKSGKLKFVISEIK